MNAQRIHYAATAALLFCAVLVAVASGYRAQAVHSQAVRVTELAREQQLRVMRLAVLASREDAVSHAELRAELRRLGDGERELYGDDPEVAGLLAEPAAARILPSDRGVLRTQAEDFARILAAARPEGRPLADAELAAVQDAAVNALSDGYDAVARAAHAVDKAEQEHSGRMLYAAFLAVAAILLYQFFVVVRPLIQAAEDDRRELSQARAELDAWVGRDNLTGLSSRRHLEEVLRREVEYVRRYGTKLAAVALDVDRFARVNAVLGQVGGDDVLQALAGLLGQDLGQDELLSRFSGDKFILLAPHVGGATAVLRAESLRGRAAEATFDKGVRVTLSCGVAECRKDDDLESFLARLDKALHQAQQAGDLTVAL